jgi:hypothetical protein
MELEEKMEDLILRMENINQLVQEKIEKRAISKTPLAKEKKNSHLHILIETSLMKKIENQAKEQGISIAEFVRQKLKDNNKLNIIEDKIDRLLKKF